MTIPVWGMWLLMSVMWACGIWGMVMYGLWDLKNKELKELKTHLMIAKEPTNIPIVPNNDIRVVS